MAEAETGPSPHTYQPYIRDSYLTTGALARRLPAVYTEIGNPTGRAKAKPRPAAWRHNFIGFCVTIVVVTLIVTAAYLVLRLHEPRKGSMQSGPPPGGDTGLSPSECRDAVKDLKDTKQELERVVGNNKSLRGKFNKVARHNKSLRGKLNKIKSCHQEVTTEASDPQSKAPGAG